MESRTWHSPKLTKNFTRRTLPQGAAAVKGTQGLHWHAARGSTSHDEALQYVRNLANSTHFVLCSRIRYAADIMHMSVASNKLVHRVVRQAGWVSHFRASWASDTRNRPITVALLVTLVALVRQ